MPKFSIIVPVYKTAEYLPKCIESILGQTCGDFELLLVDDGSPDNSLEICKEYQQKDPRIQVFHKENGGVSSARNLALEHAKGECVWFVDSDDYVDNCALEQLSDAIEHHKAELYVFNCKAVKEDFEGKLEEFLQRYYFTYVLGFGPCNKLYRLSLIRERELRFDTQESVGEDLLFNMRYYWEMALSGKMHVSFLGRDYYHYVNRPSSAMNSAFKQRLEQQLRLYGKIKAFLAEAISPEAMTYLFLLHLVSGIQQAQQGGLSKSGFKNAIQGKYTNEIHNLNRILFRFFRNEKASFAGKMRMCIFCLALRESWITLAGYLMGL